MGTQPGEGQSNSSKNRRAKGEFYSHLSAYILVNALLVGINLATSSDYLWFIWPLMGWGVGLILHGLQVFFIDKRFNDEDQN